MAVWISSETTAHAQDQDTSDAPIEAPSAEDDEERRETDCANRRDEDGDSLVDCSDSDCFGAPACASGQANENSNDRCSDWIDNDGDGAIDCDDDDCTNTPGIRACQGSWSGDGATSPGGSGGANGDDQIPELAGDETVENLIGRGGDVDGERSDEVCADGQDNDGDGRTDCADFGCRFDPSVTVCSGTPGLRFSVNVGIAGSYNYTERAGGAAAAMPGDSGIGDARFTRLQLRVLGPIPFIQNSFFLINLRAERTPRLTFALFQIPLGNGHYFNLNSGSGGLSTALVISTAKQLLLDPAFFVFNAFEQGNGGAVEVGGPIADGLFRYRVFAAAGAGESNGNIGGRFFRGEGQNFAWAAGAQLQYNIIGRYDRFDTPFLYTPVPTTLALLVGGKFDQRPLELFPAVNATAVLRWSHLYLSVESYTKFELAYGSITSSALAQLGVLVWPRHIYLAADFGGFFVPQGFQNVPPSGLSRPLQEWQARGAVHWYFWRNIGIASLLYREHHVEADPARLSDATVERQFIVEAQYRF